MPPAAGPTTATVIGGGPAGLMAAEAMAGAGLHVELFEHMPSVGRKLLLAGRSGLNLTHAEPLDDLVKRYGNAVQVGRAVREFPPTALRAWAEGLGQPTYVGSSGRVFPTSTRATPLLRAWLRRLDALGVRFQVRHRWLGWGTTPDGMPDPRVHRFQFADHETRTQSDVTVFAMGGASWPRVGSDAGWVAPFRAAGLAVHDFRPANCGVHVHWSPRFIEQFAGVPLKNVTIRVGDTTARGDATITRTGLESGPVYTLSAAIRDTIERIGHCPITIDLHPDLATPAVERRLAHRRPKDSLANFLRRSSGLAPAAIALLREATDNQLPTDAPTLARLVKAVPLRVHATASLERAISSAGGLSFDEVDDHWMLRRLPGTFVAGEMVDWEAPTGGYLLQASFSTALAAASGAVHWCDRATA